MAVVHYDTVEGEVISQHASGTQTDYMIDALGSVVGTMNQSAQVVNSYAYKPYGAQLAKTGVGVDPIFRWRSKGANLFFGRQFAEYAPGNRRYAATLGSFAASTYSFRGFSRSGVAFVVGKSNCRTAAGLFYRLKKACTSYCRADIYEDVAFECMGICDDLGWFVCGHCCWEFALEGIAPGFKGAIIQKVVNRIGQASCEQGRPQPDKVQEQYFEAWQVVEGANDKIRDCKAVPQGAQRFAGDSSRFAFGVAKGEQRVGLRVGEAYLCEDYDLEAEGWRCDFGSPRFGFWAPTTDPAWPPGGLPTRRSHYLYGAWCPSEDCKDKPCPESDGKVHNCFCYPFW